MRDERTGERPERRAPTREECIDAAAEALAASNRRLDELAAARAREPVGRRLPG